MPKALLDFMGYVFFFWSREDGEPPHVHVCKGAPSKVSAKFWIKDDEIIMEQNKSIQDAKELFNNISEINFASSFGKYSG